MAKKRPRTVSYTEHTREVQRLKAERDRLLEPYAGAAVLLRLARGLTDLNLAAHPLTAATGTGSRSANVPEPGATTRAYRAAEKRVLRKLRAVAREVEAALEDPAPDRPRRRSCPRCGRGGRPGAEICDRKACNAAELT